MNEKDSNIAYIELNNKAVKVILYADYLDKITQLEKENAELKQDLVDADNETDAYKVDNIKKEKELAIADEALKVAKRKSKQL
ncbi:MAG: hypothetical protein KAJ48_00080 [Elusimicrobiales bacterium]|nr:hypothetical protein [Elusimicrobiales bacterium]